MSVQKEFNEWKVVKISEQEIEFAKNNPSIVNQNGMASMAFYAGYQAGKKDKKKKPAFNKNCMTMVMEPLSGAPIGDCLTMAKKFAIKNEINVQFDFNGHPIFVDDNSDLEDIFNNYQNDCSNISLTMTSPESLFEKNEYKG